MAVNITTIENGLLPVLLGSKLRAKVLGWLFTHPADSYFGRQLTALLNEDSTNLSRELARLEQMGILTLTVSGKQKYYQANQKSPIYNELHSLMLKIGKGASRQDQSKTDLISRRFNISKRQLEVFCHRHHIKKLSLFGSVLREDFRPESDIDILVEFETGHVPGFGIIKMEKELAQLLGRKVDVRTPADLSRYFRDEVVREARVEYEHRQL